MSGECRVVSDERSYVDLAAEICRYLDSHPNAADSVEGIVRWWLPRQRLADNAELTQRALDYLVANNEVKATTTVDGRVVYRRVTEPDRHNPCDENSTCC